MALIFDGIQIKLVSSKVPNAFVPIPVTGFEDGEYKTLNLEVPILKSLVENPDNEVAFTSLLAALDAAIQVTLTADFDVTGTVDAFAIWDFVLLDSCGGADTSSFYTDVAPNFICGVRVFVKTT